jgi:hypothetical protein
MFGIVVYEIVAQCEPHTDKDPNQVAILIRWVCLFVSILFLSFFIWQTSHFDFLIWIQRQRIDTNNSFKLSSETCWIDANVLEETTSTTSCILFLSFCLFFVSVLSLTTITQLNKSNFFLISMMKGFWNDLRNVGTIETKNKFLCFLPLSLFSISLLHFKLFIFRTSFFH